MFTQRAVLLLLLAPILVQSGDLNGFLGPRRVFQVQDDLRGVLAEVLGEGHGMQQQKFQHIERVLTPLFRSLPKNSYGHISAPVMRYAVQRYFGQQNAWILKGFEAHTMTANLSDFSDGAPILHGKLPQFVRNELETKFSSNGFGFRDAVDIIAVLETLTFDEVLRGMQIAFKLNSFSTKSVLNHESLVDVLTSYFLVEMLEGDYGDADRHRFDKENIRQFYPHWETTLTFILDVVQNDGFTRQSLTNPFHSKSFSFEDASRFAQGITEQFGTWSGHECHEIKDRLVEFDVHGTGRVKLSDFFATSKDGSWQFTESSEYLRQLGALDESSAPLGPQVIIPNYLQGLANCIASTPFYSICCQSECNEVYQHLEAVLPPSSDSTWSADLLRSGIEEMFNQNISSFLLTRLEEVASHHGGKIPLHGRLFAQWLHYVFPRECPYPHLAETINPQTPANFEESLGRDAASASDAEVEQFLASEAALVTPSPEAGMEMWNPHEVTLHVSIPSHVAEGSFPMLARTCAICGLLLGFAGLVLKEFLPKFVQLQGKSKKVTEYRI